VGVDLLDRRLDHAALETAEARVFVVSTPESVVFSPCPDPRLGASDPTHGIAISRHDSILAAVLLNRAVLHRYLDETLGPATAAIREATLAIGN
jgi:hypothetical protein